MKTKYLKIIFLLTIFCLNFSFEVSAQKSGSLGTRKLFRESIFRESEKFIQSKSLLNYAGKEKLTESLRRQLDEILDQNNISDSSLKNLEEQERKKRFAEILTRIIDKVKTVGTGILEEGDNNIPNTSSKLRGMDRLYRTSSPVSAELIPKPKLEDSIEQLASKLQLEEATIIKISLYKDSYVIESLDKKTNDKKTEELSGYKNINRYFEKNKGLYNKNKYIFLADNKKANKAELLKVFENHLVIFSDKNHLESIKKLDELEKTRYTKKDIEILNLLPKNEKQAIDMGLKWDSNDISKTQRSLKSQMKKKDVNSKESLLEYIHSKESKLKVLLLIAHGSSTKFMLPNGEKISPEDIANLPENILKDITYILGFCEAYSEEVTISFSEALLEKGALMVLASPNKILTSNLPTFIKTLTEVVKNNRNGLEIFEDLKRVTADPWVIRGKIEQKEIGKS